MSPRVGVVTQARTSSTRLPGKVLEQVGDRTLLEHHLDRLAASGLPTLVATTTNVGDDALAGIARDRGLPVFRGSERDVLSRFAGCAREHDLDVVVRVTSDCPLIDGGLVAQGVEEFLAADDADLYLSNCLTRSYPRGLDFEVFSATALLEADERATTPADREHVTPYLHTNRNGLMRLRNLTRATDASRFRVTVDTAEDLRLVRALVEEHDAHLLDGDGLVALLEQHPELVAINGDVEQKSHETAQAAG